MRVWTALLVPVLTVDVSLQRRFAVHLVATQFARVDKQPGKVLRLHVIADLDPAAVGEPSANSALVMATHICPHAERVKVIDILWRGARLEGVA